MPLTLCDSMGLEEGPNSGLDIDDFTNILKGHIQDRYQVELNNMILLIFCSQLVFDHWTTLVTDEEQRSVKLQVCKDNNNNHFGPPRQLDYQHKQQAMERYFRSKVYKSIRPERIA